MKRSHRGRKYFIKFVAVVAAILTLGGLITSIIAYTC